MMSNVYRFQKHLFRFDFSCCVVEMLEKATDDMLQDNREWQEKYGKDFWQIDKDGYVVVDSVGLSTESWMNKEVRNEYLEGWIDELCYYAEQREYAY